MWTLSHRSVIDIRMFERFPDEKSLYLAKNNEKKLTYECVFLKLVAEKVET